MARSHSRNHAHDEQVASPLVAGDSCGTCSLAMQPDADDATALICRIDPPPQPAVLSTDWCSHFAAGAPFVPPPPELPPALTAPVNTVAPTIVQTANTISCDPGAWDNAPYAFKYFWWVDGVDAGPGHDSANLIITSLNVGLPCTCTVAARNDGGETEAASNEITVVAANAPAPRVVDVPYAEQRGELLNCTMGNWEGEPTSYSYQWYLGAVAAGGDSADFTFAPEDIGKVASCVVTATNPNGFTSAPPSNEVTIADPGEAGATKAGKRHHGKVVTVDD